MLKSTLVISSTPVCIRSEIWQENVLKKICMQLITVIIMPGQLLRLVLPLFLSMGKQIMADFS